MGNVKEHRLFLDVGNSFIKAVYKTSDAAWAEEVKRFSSVAELVSWISGGFSFNEFIISGVVSKQVSSLKENIGETKCTELHISQIPSEKLSYDTPETLGIDRFLACLGAYGASEKTVVVIDAGTACTVDIMSAEGIFEGGVIMPGLGILKKSLQEHAPVLPQVDEQIPETWPGKSTRASIQWGTVGMFRDALEAQLMRYEAAFGEFDIYITGGDAEAMQKLIDLPSHIDDKLVFRGMEVFLELFLNKS